METKASAILEDSLGSTGVYRGGGGGSTEVKRGGGGASTESMSVLRFIMSRALRNASRTAGSFKTSSGNSFCEEMDLSDRVYCHVTVKTESKSSIEHN